MSVKIFYKLYFAILMVVTLFLITLLYTNLKARSCYFWYKNLTSCRTSPMTWKHKVINRHKMCQASGNICKFKIWNWNSLILIQSYKKKRIDIFFKWNLTCLHFIKAELRMSFLTNSSFQNFWNVILPSLLPAFSTFVRFCEATFHFPNFEFAFQPFNRKW